MTPIDYLLGISGSVIANLLYDAAKGNYRGLNDALYDAALSTSAYFSKEKGIEFDAAAFLEFLSGETSANQVARFQSGHEPIDDNTLAVEFAKLGQIYFDDPDTELMIARQIFAHFKQRFEALLVAKPETASPLFMAYIRSIRSESRESHRDILEKLRAIDEKLKSWPEPMVEAVLRRTVEESNSYDAQLHELAESTGITYELLKEQVDDWISNVTTPYQRGLAAQWTRNFTEAARLIRISITEAERNIADKYVSLGICQCQGLEREEADKSLLRAIELNDSNLSAFLMMTMLNLQSGRYGEAQQALDKALALSRSSRVLNYQGMLLQWTGKHSLAVTSFEMALKSAPDDQSARMNLAVCLIELGRLDEAQALLDVVTSTANPPPSSWSHFADLYIKLGDPAKAKKCFEKAIELHPWEPAAYNNYAKFLMENGDLNGAVSKLEQAIIIEPRYANAIFNLGVCFDRLGESDKAVGAFKRVLDVPRRSSLTGKPRHVEAAVEIARIQIVKGEYEEGVKYCDLAIKYDDTYADAYGLKGLAFKRQGDLSRAKDFYRKGLERNNANARIRYNLACVHALQGDRKAAMRELQLAVEDDEGLKQYAREDKDFERFQFYKDFMSIVR